jgi:uncharacterized protein (TIGR03032 family)
MPRSQEPAALIGCTVSDGFREWISWAAGALAITTYQAGKVVLVGWDGRQVTVLPRQFDKPMGLAIHGGRLALATRHEVCLFANAPILAREFLEGQPGRYDALYLPRAVYHTGDLNTHDLAFGREGVWLVNTRFSCLSGLSHDYSLVPRWRPPFISEVVPEDRCHLNGLAQVDGRPRFVTALGATDTVGGWRAKKATGGVLLDVETGSIIRSDLSMPHSPRWHDGQLWVLNSGTGELWQVEPRSGRHALVCALPGYLRGLDFAGPYALIGLSQIRERHIFGGLPVQERWPALQCGVALIDLRSGVQTGFLQFNSGCQELFAVQFLPGVLRPMILNPAQAATRQAFTAPEFAYWLRPSAALPSEPGDSASGSAGE